MKHIAIMLAVLMGVGLTNAATTQAEAKDGRHRAFAAGAVTGLVVGGILGASANDRHYDRRHYHDRRYYRNGGYYRSKGHYRHHHPRHVYRHNYHRPNVYYVAPRRHYVVRDRGYSYASAHRQWCENRYRSYDAGSNTWVTYGGVVKQCASPYN